MPSSDESPSTPRIENVAFYEVCRRAIGRDATIWMRLSAVRSTRHLLVQKLRRCVLYIEDAATCGPALGMHCEFDPRQTLALAQGLEQAISLMPTTRLQRVAMIASRRELAAECMARDRQPRPREPDHVFLDLPGAFEVRIARAALQVETHDIELSFAQPLTSSGHMTLVFPMKNDDAAQVVERLRLLEQQLHEPLP